MRLVSLHYTGLPRLGGLELASYHLAAAASRRPHWRALLLNGTRPDKTRSEDAPPQEVIPEISTEHPLNRRVYHALLCGHRHPLLESMAQRVYRALDRRLRPGDLLVSFNVLSVHYNPALTIALRRFVTQRTDVRHLAWIFDINDCLLQPPDSPKGLLWSELWGLSHRTIYCACSSPVASRFAAALGISRSLLHVIPPGIDVPTCLRLTERVTHVWRSRLVNAWPILFMPARISARKNIPKALDMMSHLRLLFPNAQLVIAGALSPHDEGSHRRLAELQGRRKYLRLQEAVTILSADVQPDTTSTFEDCMSMMAITDAVLLTSEEEGFLIPVLEAALHRVPIYAPALPSLKSWATTLAKLYSVKLDSRELATWLGARIRHDTFHGCHLVRQQYGWDAVLEHYFLPLAKETR